MTPSDILRIEPLRVAHIAELAVVLRHPAVYAHLEPDLPSLDDIQLELACAIAPEGPPKAGLRCLHFLARDLAGTMVGRLEANCHHGLVEVALLFDPRCWGRGLASAGLAWLHAEVARTAGMSDFWATVAPANHRSRRLFERAGYRECPLPGVPLYSHAEGDAVYRRVGVG